MMGQYYKVVNLDKKQFVYPRKLGDGLKLGEFGCSANGTMTALALLLAEGNGRGGGDYFGDSPLVGSWARDRVVIVGDYADSELYDTIESQGEDISLKILAAVVEFCPWDWFEGDVFNDDIEPSERRKVIRQALLDSAYEPVGDGGWALKPIEYEGEAHNA